MPPPAFKIGSRVFLANRTLSRSVGIGTVVNVIPCDSRLPDFTLYDVSFASGLQTVHGSALRPVLPTVFSCDEKHQLWMAHKKALDIYLRGLTRLTQAAGTMAHTEFEFLRSNVAAAREFVALARKKLNEHTAEHGC